MISDSDKIIARNKAYQEAGHNAYFGNGFTAGVKFAEQHLQSEKAELVDALRGLMSDIGGGKKKCGHDFDCRCAWDKAKQLLTKING